MKIANQRAAPPAENGGGKQAGERRISGGQAEYQTARCLPASAEREAATRQAVETICVRNQRVAPSARRGRLCLAIRPGLVAAGIAAILAASLVRVTLPLLPDVIAVPIWSQAGHVTGPAAL